MQEKRMNESAENYSDLQSRLAKFRNLVFQGGSIRGIGHAGAYKALLAAGFTIDQIEKIGGASAGAITALLLSVGYSAEEMEQIVMELNFRSFLDEQSGNVSDALLQANQKKGFLAKTGLFASKSADSTVSRASERLHSKYGLFDGEVFRLWAEECIQKKTSIEYLTFKELHQLHEKDPIKYKDLYVVGVCVNTGETKVFSYETTPNVIISDAVRISMSIPFIFVPHKKYIKKDAFVGRMAKAKASDKFYMDGGVLDNYPFWLFGHNNPETLGFRLVDEPRKNFLQGEGTLPLPEINGIVSYTKKVVEAIYHKQESDHMHEKGERRNTIYISTCGIDMLEFDLSQEKKQLLLDAGVQGVEDFSKREATSEDVVDETPIARCTS